MASDEEDGGSGNRLSGAAPVSGPDVHRRSSKGALQTRQPQYARLLQEEETCPPGSAWIHSADLMRCSCCLFHFLDFASSDAVSQRDDCRNSAWLPCQQETRSFPLLWWYHQGKARPWRCSLLTVLTSCLMVLCSQRKARGEQPMAERRLRHISPDGVTRKAGKENVLSPGVR